MIDEDDAVARFEQERVELFRRHGFACETASLTDSEGRRIAAVMGGEGTTPVILLHGALSQAGEWALVAGKLSGRVIAVDWPGSGLSDPVGIRRSGLRGFGERLLSDVVDALDVQRVDIVGSSTGGYFGLVFALAHPERVRRCVQVGAPPGLVRTVPMIFRLFATRGIGSLVLRRQPRDAEANRKQVFSNLVAHPQRIPVDMLEQDMHAMALPNAVASATDFARALVHPLTGLRGDVMLDRELRSLQTPTLMLWGTDDNFIRPEKAAAVLNGVPSIQLQTIEDSGHLLTFERPESVAEALSAFLSHR